ncbi:MAG: molybdenum ABC transporter ATP-binding protein [Myxococcales bacterium]|nr:molybdenum ABC transporter ATP-binding protein [Myxococcales bacterium]
MTLAVDLQLPLDRFELKLEVELTAQVTALFGPSGAGKTSLLECIAGLRRGATGRITFNGAAWLDTAQRLNVPPERRRIGYVPQDGLLFPHLNTRENLLSGAQRQSSEQVTARLEQVSRVLQLEPLWSRRPSTLSGGERQRVALGRALCSAPDLLLLDEPLGALDIALKRRLLPFLRQVREEFAVPMLLVSHSPGEVLALCDEVLAFDTGRVVARGRPEDVLMGKGRLEGGEAGSTLALLRGTDELESTLPCEIVQSSDDRCVVRLESGTQLFCRALRESLNQDAHKHALVSVAARDVIVARSQPERISARNVLLGQVRQVDAGGVIEVALLHQVDQAPPAELDVRTAAGLLVELSHSAIRELGLEAGLAVYVVIKSSACVVSPAQG